MLQPKQSCLQVIAPLPRMPEQMAANPVTLYKMNPLAPGKLPEEFTHAEVDLAKTFCQGADADDPIIIPLPRHHKGLPVQGEEIIRTASMIDVTAHQVNPSRRANNDYFPVIPEPFAKDPEHAADFIDFFMM